MLSTDWKKWRNLIIEAIKDTYYACRLLKIQIFIAVLSIILFLLPGQIIEIYRLLSEDYASRWPQIVMAIFGITFLIFMLWYSGRWMTIDQEIDLLNTRSRKTTLLKWLPRLLGIAPAVGIGIFLLFTPGSLEALLEGGSNFWIRITGLTILVIAVTFLLFTIFRTRFGTRAGLYSHDLGFGMWAIRIAQILPFVLFLAVLVAPIGFPTFVGTLFLTSVFIALVTFLLSWSSLFARRTGFPLTFVLFGMAIVWSFMDFNDNHEVRSVPLVKNEWTYPRVDAAFEQWLSARSDIKAYADKELTYPVYVVAVEGGGIYAAHHAATFLARIQDHCPSFSRHVFAISAVSGGALGSSVFTGLLNSEKNNNALPSGSDITPCKVSNGEPGGLESDVDEIFGADLLSPLVASTLFKDGPQRFLPWSIPSFDRARALEDGVKAAWVRRGYEKDGLDQSVVDAWSHAGDVPALVLNNTKVSTGQRVATSPFAKNQLAAGSIESTQRKYLPDGYDLSLLSGAVLSARFTYITPAGTLYLPDNERSYPWERREKVRLVDGGYFEGSGVDTAADIIEAIRPLAVDADADIRLISLRYATISSEPNHYLGETLSPFRALLGSRTRRGQVAVTKARSLLVGFCPSKGEPTSKCDDFTDISDPMRVSYINDPDRTLPLGWLLSKKSRAFISDQVGWAHKCDYVRGYAGSDTKGEQILDHENDCLMKFIEVELESGIREAIPTLGITDL